MNCWFRRIVSFAAFAYPAALGAIAVLLRIVGERWWVTSALLYVPRIAFGLPGPFIALALLVQRRRWLLLTQLAAGAILLFPLMGWVIPRLPSVPAGRSTVRVLSLNAENGEAGVKALLRPIDQYSPDIVLMQAMVSGPTQPLFTELQARYKTVNASTQFVIASRYPLTVTTNPKRAYEGKPRTQRFIRYVVDTPLGAVAFYSVHPISPRDGFYAFRSSGLGREILSGGFLAGPEAASIQSNSDLRSVQVDGFAALAKTENVPVLIAGDTNLPGLSPVLARLAEGYQDGFGEAGWGFGYTFPATHAWMRIDRMLASSSLRFLHFEVGCTGVSDHLCIVADISRRE